MQPIAIQVIGPMSLPGSPARATPCREEEEEDVAVPAVGATPGPAGLMEGRSPAGPLDAAAVAPGFARYPTGVTVSACAKPQSSSARASLP